MGDETQKDQGNREAINKPEHQVKSEDEVYQSSEKSFRDDSMFFNKLREIIQPRSYGKDSISRIFPLLP